MKRLGLKAKNLLFPLGVLFFAWPFIRGVSTTQPPSPTTPAYVPPISPTHPYFRVGQVIGLILTEAPAQNFGYFRIDGVVAGGANLGVYNMFDLNPYNWAYGQSFINNVDMVDKCYELWKWARYD